MGTIKAYDLLIEVSDADTKILPVHGVISNVADVRAFRDMMLVIRDRVAAAIRGGKSLEETQAAGLTAEYDERWDSGRRIGSAATLIESVYIEMV